jgi:hypothetical protein
LLPQNIFNISEHLHQTPILEEPIPPLGHEQAGLRNIKTDAILRLEFVATINNLWAEVGLLKKQSATRDYISCFQDLLPSVQPLEDIWLSQTLVELLEPGAAMTQT